MAPDEKSDPKVPPAYLTSPPDIIPIDVGRQLFVDDFLIESTDMERIYHKAESYIGNPVLKPDKSWQKIKSLSSDVNSHPKQNHKCSQNA